MEEIGWIVQNDPNLWHRLPMEMQQAFRDQSSSLPETAPDSPVEGSEDSGVPAPRSGYPKPSEAKPEPRKDIVGSLPSVAQKLEFPSGGIN